jgi:hypothetical protein
LTEKAKTENLLALAQYCGTSVAMLENNYVRSLKLKNLGLPNQNQTTSAKPQPASAADLGMENKYSIRSAVSEEAGRGIHPALQEKGLAGPGFEPGTSRL